MVVTDASNEAQGFEDLQNSGRLSSPQTKSAAVAALLCHSFPSFGGQFSSERSRTAATLTSITGIKLERLFSPNDVEKGWYGRVKGVGPAHNELVNTEQEDVSIN